MKKEIKKETSNKQEIIAKFQTSKKDTGSMQVQIAVLSQEIAELAEHLKLHKKDNSCRKGLIAKVNQRKRCLNYLQKHDLNSYNDIISKLNLRK